MAKTQAERNAQIREWARKNPEKKKAIQQRYLEKNREAIRARQRATAKEQYQNNPDFRKANLDASKRYHAANKVTINARSNIRNKSRYASDPEYRARVLAYAKKRNEENPTVNRKRSKAWRAKHPGSHWRYAKARLASDPQFAIAHRVRNRISTALRRGRRGVKSAKSIDLLGCTIEFYMPYLEARFTTGMTWENRHLWHIDHIVALKHFNLLDADEQKQAFHFTNTQPLWKPDNLRKGAKIAA